MSLAWPFAVLALLVPVGLVVAYVRSLRRRRAGAYRYPDLALIRAAAGTRRGWRRHLPVALLAAGMALLALAAARPQVETAIPMDRTTIILAIDVSRSMCETDVSPNRLTAAEEAVRGFITDQADDTRMGLVAFAGYAELVVPPTTDKDELLSAVDGLTTGRGTTIGSAILKSVDAIAEVNPDVAPVGTDEAQGSGTDGTDGTGSDSGGDTGSGSSGDMGTSTEPVPDIVVLLTDGANTRGVTPQQAAAVAAERGVRVYPIGFGTTSPQGMVCTADQLGADAFGGDLGGLDFSSGDIPTGELRSVLMVDEAALQDVADATGATYHRASDRQQLSDVLQNLPRDVVLTHERVEISAWLAGLAALLVVAALVVAGRPALRRRRR